MQPHAVAFAPSASLRVARARPVTRARPAPAPRPAAAPLAALAPRRRPAPRCCAPAPASDPLALAADSASTRLAPAHAHAHAGGLEGADGAAELAGGGGGGEGGGGGGGRSQGGGGGGGGEGEEDLPGEVAEALSAGLISAEAMAQYRRFVQLPVLGWLMSVPAFRTRMLADPAFFFKLMVQEVVGNGTALASEITERGPAIADELEYVASDLIVGTVVEAAFVWLLAPTLALPGAPAGSALSRYLAALPANAFVASTPARSFSAAQRTAAFVYAGAQYALIGFAAGIVGTAITYALIEGRKRVDPAYTPKRPLPDVVPNAAAWGAFMALSSNTRFQIVEGLERGIAVLCKGTSAPVVNYGIVALRTVNNYWGGVQFVQFFRFLGLHATEDHGKEE